MTVWFLEILILTLSIANIKQNSKALHVASRVNYNHFDGAVRRGLGRSRKLGYNCVDPSVTQFYARPVPRLRMRRKRRRRRRRCKLWGRGLCKTNSKRFILPGCSVCTLTGIGHSFPLFCSSFGTFHLRFRQVCSLLHALNQHVVIHLLLSLSDVFFHGRQPLQSLCLIDHLAPLASLSMFLFLTDLIFL